MTDIVDSEVLKSIGLNPMRLATKEHGETQTFDPSTAKPDCFSKAVKFCDRVIKTGKPFDVILQKAVTYEILGLEPYLLFSALLEEHEHLGETTEEDRFQISDLIERYRIGYEATHKSTTG